ncbi:hypothetical protein DFQ28_000294 [Apophysomyces sp. BC1034]|nr:hypothetical protein DFQ30_000553 [Apophysomyces sp. BC1015]KAG0167997.1 hypothetical protein DFQ29_000168 [Apophysomyces sp. BC1021]KAG0184017.1 hypothetical protein DFQ28_000294 [Apophysomyces sp. BC1034]
MSNFITNDVTTLVREVVKLIENQADDWINVVPEALALMSQCSVIETILPSCETELSENSLQYKCMSKMKTILESAKKEIDEFITQDTKQRNLWGKMLWKSKRVALATVYRERFRKKAEALAGSIQNITAYLKLGDAFRKVTIDHVKHLMSLPSYEFWMTYIGQDLSGDNIWSTFIQQYQIMFGHLSEDTIESIRRIACVTKTDLTIYGFIRLTNEFDFPIDEDLLPPLPQSSVVMSEEGRIQIAEMVISLMSDFSSKEMQQHLIHVYTWYRDVQRHDIRGLQKRADEWAEYLKQSRDIDEKAPEHIEADHLDFSRRTISLFYQRYMVMWRIGRVSREMLSDVDFPGRMRIQDFLRYILPLDNAHYRIVMGQDSTHWDHRKPKVYSFLKELL